jgi:hypothetical protein
MLLIDGLIHALHFGPLAPLFIEGEKDHVLELLDELAGCRTPAPPASG